MEITELAVRHSNGRVSLKTKGPKNEHFVICDGKQVGRSVEEYQHMGTQDWGLALGYFLREVLEPIHSRRLRESFAIAGGELRKLGHEVYDPEMLDMWDNLFQ